MNLLALAAALVLADASPPSAVEGMTPVSGHPTLLASGVPEIPAPLAERLAQYLEPRSAALLDVTADGQAMLVATRFGSTLQLHLVEQPLGARTQLTFSREPIRVAAFRPGDPRQIFYLQDRGGGEAHQVFRLDRRTGRSEMLTDGRSRHEAMVLSPDGRRIAWSGTGRNGKDTDVYLAELDRPREARRVVEGEGTFHAADFSPDGQRLLVVRFRSIADADLLLVDLATGERRQLTPSEGKGSVRAAAFAADGRSVYLVTDRYGDFEELYRLDLAPGATPRPLARTLRWDVDGLAVARDGSRVAFTVNADGYSRLYLLEPRSGRLEPVSLPAGVVGRLAFPDRRGGQLALSITTPRSPLDAWQLDLRSRKLTRWTRSEVGGLDPAAFVEPQLVRYPSTDGLSIPAWLYLPPRAAWPGRRPVVVSWHGGPEAQERPWFGPLYQFLAVEMGLAVLAPNVRGSAGYGKAYLSMDDGVKRERALADVGATLDFVAARPELDPARVAVHGGSYGGYLTLATAAFHPERIRAAVDVVGISSLVSFLQNTSEYRRDLRRAEYGDERDPAVRAVLERISPLGKVGAIRAALFVQQGRNDPRVPQSEAEQIVKAVRDAGREVWYLLALDEGHGFAKKENRDLATQATVLFLQRTLGSGDGQAEVPAAPPPVPAASASPPAAPGAGPPAAPAPAEAPPGR
ncbi:MAG TPA: S9 family peptidase [Anaeromyxobacteraceae bacterium]|nr:S9 family peptidase [Anaeromyxobacteraceae bacterium]